MLTPDQKFTAMRGDVELTAEVSPCCFMYGSGLQITVYLPDRGRTYVLKKEIPIKDATEEDCHALLETIAMHPEASRKIGVGIDHFRIQRNALGAGKGIKFVRVDGSEDGFSYKRCITGAIQSPHGKVCEALRFTVHSQLIAFRDALGLPVRCATSGVIITDRKNLHIDHREPF